MGVGRGSSSFASVRNSFIDKKRREFSHRRLIAPSVHRSEKSPIFRQSVIARSTRIFIHGNLRRKEISHARLVITKGNPQTVYKAANSAKVLICRAAIHMAEDVTLGQGADFPKGHWVTKFEGKDISFQKGKWNRDPAPVAPFLIVYTASENNARFNLTLPGGTVKLKASNGSKLIVCDIIAHMDQGVETVPPQEEEEETLP